MFIKGKCAIYIDKNPRVYEKSTGIFVLWRNVRGCKNEEIFGPLANPFS